MTREFAIEHAKHILGKATCHHHVTISKDVLAALVQSPWISVKDRLPEDGQLIVYACLRDFSSEFGTIYYPESYITDTMDYWMPVPDLSKEG